MAPSKSKFLEVEGHKIHYKVSGSGATTLLLIHGAVGSINDFSLQMEGENRLSGDEYTVVAFDLPGQGNSVPIKNEPKVSKQEFSSLPSLEYFELSATIAAKLMASLGYVTYSVGGWSDGARVAALLAIRYQSRVNSLLLWAFVPIMDKFSCDAISRTRDTETWDPKALEAYTCVYGEAKFSELWKGYVDYIISTLELPDQFDIRERLCAIKCPTIVLHGKEDPIVSFRGHIKPLEMQIYNSEIVQIPGLAHNIHQASPSLFKGLLERFVAAAAY